jgi:hypothetical protein
METVPLFGGNRGGKPRKDGLVPGSAEAVEADRKYERERKADQRAKTRAENPPALPPALPGKVPAPSNNFPAPGAALAVDSTAQAPPSVPWQADTFAELARELVPELEAQAVASITRRAAKAGLSKDFLKEIEHDCRWGEATKKALVIALPQLVAKWLNRSGVSSEWQPEVVCGTAAAKILVNHLRIVNRLDKLIAQREEAEKARGGSTPPPPLPPVLKP